MTDDAKDRLEAHGRSPMPAADAAFADLLESKLRAEHASLAPSKGRRVRSFLPRLAVVAAVVIAGVVGVGALGTDDAGVPVAVVDEDPAALLDVTDGGGDGEDGSGQDGGQGDRTNDDAAAVAPTATPTPTATPAPASQAQAPTPTAPPSTADESAQDAAPAPVVQQPTPTVTPLPTVTPSPLPTATPPIAAPTAVPVPAATATPAPTPTVAPTPTPTATPTPEREPAPIELNCEERVVDEAVGVVCNWTAPQIDRAIASYELSRSRNGSDAAIVSRQRAQAPTTYADRDIDFDDQVIYLVQGLDADGAVVAASIREIVLVPSS